MGLESLRKADHLCHGFLEELRPTGLPDPCQSLLCGRRSTPGLQSTAVIGGCLAQPLRLGNPWRKREPVRDLRGKSWGMGCGAWALNCPGDPDGRVRRRALLTCGKGGSGPWPVPLASPESWAGRQLPERWRGAESPAELVSQR